MPLNSESVFHKVVVNFNPATLGVDSITAYREIDAADGNDPPTWTAIQILPNLSLNERPLPGLYDVEDSNFAECVRRIRAGSVDLFYTFDDVVEISVDDAKGSKSKNFGHLLDHDPIYREVQRQEAAAAMPFLQPIDKIFYTYSDESAPPLPNASSDNSPEAHLKAMANANWYPSQELAKAADLEGKLHQCLASYYDENGTYQVEVTRIDVLSLRIRGFEVKFPILLS